jgi:hypothetical protein
MESSLVQNEGGVVREYTGNRYDRLPFKVVDLPMTSGFDRSFRYFQFRGEGEQVRELKVPSKEPKCHARAKQEYQGSRCGN